MNPLLEEVRRKPMLRLPVFAPGARIAAFITVNGRSAWFVGVLLLIVYPVFAMTLNLLPPPAH